MTTKLVAAKRFVVVSDVARSTSLLQQIDSPIIQLRCKARDPVPMHCMTCSFTSFGGTMHPVAADLEGNVRVLEYGARSFESQKLPTVADWKAGGTVSVMAPCRLADPRSGFATPTPHIGTIMCTAYGEMLLLAEVDEMSHRRLELVTSTIGKALPHAAGLAADAWRASGSAATEPSRRRGGVIDGSALNRFLAMDLRLQRELCSAVGVSQDSVALTLRDMEVAASVF
jgi:hypothetical protein